MQIEAKKRLTASRETILKGYADAFKAVVQDIDKHMRNVSVILKGDHEKTVPFTEIRPVIEAANELKLAIEAFNSKSGHHIHSATDIVAELLET